MKTSFQQLTGIIALSLVSFAPVSTHAADTQYKLLKEIMVGGEGGWDALTVDSAAERLYVSHATKVVVIDLSKDQVAGEITNTAGVHDIAVAPELNRVYVSCGKDNKVAIVDSHTLQTLSKVETGQNPDLLIYEPKHQEVYAFNGRSQDASVIDAKTGKVIATIPLGGKPEFAKADPKAGRVFVNLEDKSEVAVIDTGTHMVTNRWPIAPGEEATGLAIDLENHRLFLGCGNKLMVMLDNVSGKVLASVPVGEGVDGCEYDRGTQLAFAPSGDGKTTIVHENTPDKLTIVQTLATAPRARTMALDPKTHKIYLPTASFEPQPEQTPGAPRSRPKIIPGSFKVMVYGPDKS